MATTKIPATLRGNVVADPEYGTTNTGKPWANFTLAVSARFLNDQNEWETSDTEFHDVTAYGALAENLQRSGLSKGHPVIAEGQFSFGEYKKSLEGKDYTFQTRVFEASSIGPDLVKTAVAFAPRRREGVDASPKVEHAVAAPATAAPHSPSL